MKRPKKFKPGTVALREIRKYQKGTEFLLRRGPFARLARQVVVDIRLERCKEVGGGGYEKDWNMQAKALEAL